MSIAPEPYLTAYLYVLEKSTLHSKQLAVLMYNSFSSRFNKKNYKQIIDLNETIHNIPEMLNDWEKCDESKLKLSLYEYDKRWADIKSSFSLIRTFEEGVNKKIAIDFYDVMRNSKNLPDYVNESVDKTNEINFDLITLNMNEINLLIENYIKKTENKSEHEMIIKKLNDTLIPYCGKKLIRSSFKYKKSDYLIEVDPIQKKVVYWIGRKMIEVIPNYVD